MSCVSSSCRACHSNFRRPHTPAGSCALSVSTPNPLHEHTGWLEPLQEPFTPQSALLPRCSLLCLSADPSALLLPAPPEIKPDPSGGDPPSSGPSLPHALIYLGPGSCLLTARPHFLAHSSFRLSALTPVLFPGTVLWPLFMQSP